MSASQPLDFLLTWYIMFIKQFAVRKHKTAIRLLADGFGGLCFHRADAREQKGLSSFERALRNRKAAIQPLADGICGRRNNVI